jgi:hypothetical protein
VYIGAVLRQVVEGGQVSVHCQSISYLVCSLASVNARDSSRPLFVTDLTPRRYRCYNSETSKFLETSHDASIDKENDAFRDPGGSERSSG